MTRATTREKFEAKHDDLYEALRAVGHEPHTWTIHEEFGFAARLACLKCGKEWRGKRAQRRGRGLTPEIPCTDDYPAEKRAELAGLD